MCTFKAFTLAGTVLKHIGMYPLAYKIFESVRDIANELKDWGQMIQVYSNLAVILCECKKYDLSLISAKKML